MPLLQQSWQRAWGVLQAQPQAKLFERLVAGYGEPQRRYHTLQHLVECLEILQSALGLTEHPGEVELALWFHDAVYELTRQDNELQSALWARREIVAAGASNAVAQRIHALVLATRHTALPASPDQCLLVDIDLSILGAPIQRFQQYESQVREEYGALADEPFRRKRLALLRELLGRSPLFSTQHFRTRFETQARSNLQRSIAQLAA